MVGLHTAHYFPPHSLPTSALGLVHRYLSGHTSSVDSFFVSSVLPYAETAVASRFLPLFAYPIKCTPSQKVTHLLTDSQHDEFGILHIWDRKAEQTSIKSTREVCFRSVRIDFSTATRPEISSFMVGNTYVCWAFLKHPEFRLREEYA